MKLIDILLEDWWDKLSPEEQSDYIKKHPDSKKALDSKSETPKVDIPLPKINIKDFMPKFDFSQSPKETEFSNGYVKADKPIPSPPREKLSYKLDTSPIKTEEDFQNWKSSYMESGDLIENMSGYAAEVQESHMNFRKSLSKKETKQLEKDIDFWKMKGGYDAYTYADNDEERQQVVERNERLSSMAHESVVKIKQPLERGISVPKGVTEQILSMYKVGEDTEIPGKDSHGCSGFSLSGKVARKFSGTSNLDSTIDSDEDSILFRILPNSNSEVRGLFVDGDPSAEDDGFIEEMEILRSPKSKLKVKSIQKKMGPNGNQLTIIEFEEPDSFNETIMKENKKITDKVSLRYLSGPVNRERTKRKGSKRIKLSDLIKNKKN
jgi:hypothetical protein